MSGKSYPYISKALESGTTAIAYKEDRAIVMNSKTWAAGDGDDRAIDEEYFTNITREYLQNTYGEVKNKRHADFLIELADANGIKVTAPWLEGELFCFESDDSGGLKLSFYNERLASEGEETLITIPEPPESWKPDVDEEEWPKVGGKVKINSKNLLGLEDYYGHCFTVIGIAEALGNKVLTIQHNNRRVFAVYMGGWVEKPKTPVEELVGDIFHSLSLPDRDFGLEAARGVTAILLEKYNITKKES